VGEANGGGPWGGGKIKRSEGGGGNKARKRERVGESKIKNQPQHGTLSLTSGAERKNPGKVSPQVDIRKGTRANLSQRKV